MVNSAPFGVFSGLFRLFGLLLRLRLGSKFLLGPTDIQLSTLILEVHFFTVFGPFSAIFRSFSATFGIGVRVKSRDERYFVGHQYRGYLRISL